jgi:HTH domain.
MRSYSVDLKRLGYMKIMETFDMLEAVDIKKVLNKTQRRIIEELERDEGYISQKQLLSRLDISKQSLITNIKNLEEAGIVFTERSSTKFIYMNPAVSYLRDLSKLAKEHILANKKIYDKIAKLATPNHTQLTHQR